MGLEMRSRWPTKSVRDGQKCEASVLCTAELRENCRISLIGRIYLKREERLIDNMCWSLKKSHVT